MNDEAMKEVLNELFSHLERLETQSEAILQFLKEKKRVTDKQLAPYLEQAGNTANVKWRAARVRIDHLLEPEHPEEEIKLGRRPEVHEDSSSKHASAEKRSESGAKEDKRTQSVDKESKRTIPGGETQIESSDKGTEKPEVQHAESSSTDASRKENPALIEATQAHSTDGNQNKSEERSESKQRNTEQARQGQRAQKYHSDDLHHPTEVTEPLAEQQGAEPPAQLKPHKTDNGKEAA